MSLYVDRFKLALVGSRSYTFYNDFIVRVLRRFGRYEWSRISEIVSGGAPGVDTLAEQFASDHGLAMKVFPADWDKHGKAAGPIRNKQVVDYSDMMLAIWDGKSKGTRNAINQMLDAGKPVIVDVFEEGDFEDGVF